MSTSKTRTRQKSCVPCVSSKRKCDQTMPICSRCMAKNMFCTYKACEASQVSQVSQASSSASESPQYGNVTQYGTAMDFSNVMVGKAAQQISPPFSMSSEFDMGLPVSSMDHSGGGLFLNTISAPDSSQIGDDFFTAYDAHILSPLFPTMGVMELRRAKYCVAALRAYPSHLALTSKTMFINPFCYPTLPPALQEAFCVAALYNAKNDRNEDIVREIVRSKANKLAGESRNSWTVSDHLAVVQAMIIFQIIRLFDGDITQRAEAEEHEPILREWTQQLMHRTGIKTTSTSDVLLTSYSAWLFTESINRTIIVSLLVEAMFSIQKRGFCTLVDEVTDMSFTAQRALWEATSEQHWMRSKMEKEGFYVQKMGFGEVIERATIEDIDDLGFLMLVTYKGVDGVNEWILRSGSTALIDS